MVYIGSDLPDEFTGSNYTKKLKGTLLYLYDLVNIKKETGKPLEQ